MKVLVTGAAGFVGSHVAESLTRSGHEPFVFDMPDRQGMLQRYDIDLPFRGGDLRDLAALQSAAAGMDAICHLAGVGDVYLAFEKPYLAAEANVAGTANVLEAALREGVRRVVYASTWEVYGEPLYQPMDEQHPCNPDHPYNITKYAGERLVVSYGKLKGLHTVALRLGTAYGTRMRPNSVFSVFIEKAIAGEPITIQGSGKQARQFTHARDIAEAFCLALDRGKAGDVFNVAADENVSILELASLITARLPTDQVFAPSRAGEVPPAIVSSNKVHRELLWHAKVNFAEGVHEIIEEHLRVGQIAG